MLNLFKNINIRNWGLAAIAVVAVLFVVRIYSSANASDATASADA